MWWRAELSEHNNPSIRKVDSPSGFASRWRWVQYDWSDGGRSAYCNVWCPWEWMAKLMAAYLRRGTGVSGERWKS